MKQAFIGFSILFLMGCFLNGCGKHTGDKHRKIAEAFDESVTESGNEWVLYRSIGFTIKFPPIFQLDTSGYRKTDLILYTELTDDADLYKDNIAIQMKEREDNLSLEAYGKQCEGYIMHYTESPEIVSSSLKKRNGIEYYEIIYAENQSDFRLMREQHVLFSEQHVFTITLTCEDFIFDQCKDVGEAIMSTFTIE